MQHGHVLLPAGVAELFAPCFRDGPGLTLGHGKLDLAGALFHVLRAAGKRDREFGQRLVRFGEFRGLLPLTLFHFRFDPRRLRFDLPIEFGDLRSTLKNQRNQGLPLALGREGQRQHVLGGIAENHGRLVINIDRFLEGRRPLSQAQRPLVEFRHRLFAVGSFEAQLFGHVGIAQIVGSLGGGQISRHQFAAQRDHGLSALRRRG